MYVYIHSGKYFKFDAVNSKSNVFNREFVRTFNATVYEYILNFK